MTLSYLDAQGIRWKGAEDLSAFHIPGNQQYGAADGSVPGDFSSAAFPVAAAALSGGPLTIRGLDREDSQGDKAVLDILAALGCTVQWKGGDLRISRSGPLRGGSFDLNDIPDALPALASVAAYAQGETRLYNVAHARIKETDRVAVMAAELGKMGADIQEEAGGLRIRGTPLHGAVVESHGDHRVAMALAVAALSASGPVDIRDAQSASVTYPGFWKMLGAETIG
jgi:3-phosphoshikimate 1-carboxyvinyltransferase